MIVLDEQISDPRVITAIKRWYPGKVMSIKEARPHTRVLDDVMSALLHRLKEPTFVTTNYKDFWPKIAAHTGYSVICINLPIQRALEVPGMLRELLKRPEWNTKRKRLGKVIAISGQIVSYYD